MKFLTPLAPVIRVFLLIAVGFVFAHWKKINLSSVTEIIVCLGTPSLDFTSLVGKPLYGALPAAVINFILTEKYRQDPALAASIVVISTGLSLVTIPLVFWLII